MINSRDFQDAAQIQQLSQGSGAATPRANAPTPSFSGLAALGHYASFSPPAPAGGQHATLFAAEEDIDAMA